MSLSEQWDGVPVVRMVGDSDEDVHCFVKVLYNRECVFFSHFPAELKLTFVIYIMLFAPQFLPDVRACHCDPAHPHVARQHEHQIRRSHHPNGRNR